VDVDNAAIYMPWVTAIAAVSCEQGLEQYRTYNGAVNSELFADFLNQLSLKHERKPFALFMDQASYHKS